MRVIFCVDPAFVNGGCRPQSCPGGSDMDPCGMPGKPMNVPHASHMQPPSRSKESSR
jgi:hypothetical protein